MPIGKEKKSVQAYVKNITKDKIVKIAKDKNLTESKVAGDILDKFLDGPYDYIFKP